MSGRFVKMPFTLERFNKLSSDEEAISVIQTYISVRQNMNTASEVTESVQGYVTWAALQGDNMLSLNVVATLCHLKASGTASKLDMFRPLLWRPSWI